VQCCIWCCKEFIWKQIIFDWHELPRFMWVSITADFYPSDLEHQRPEITTRAPLHIAIFELVCPFDHRMMPWKFRFRDNICNGSGAIVLTDRQTDKQTNGHCWKQYHLHCVSGKSDRYNPSQYWMPADTSWVYTCVERSWNNFRLLSAFTLDTTCMCIFDAYLFRTTSLMLFSTSVQYSIVVGKATGLNLPCRFLGSLKTYSHSVNYFLLASKNFW